MEKAGFIYQSYLPTDFNNIEAAKLLNDFKADPVLVTLIEETWMEVLPSKVSDPSKGSDPNLDREQRVLERLVTSIFQTAMNWSKAPSFS